MTGALDSPILAHIASQEIAALAEIFAAAYLRLAQGQNCAKEVDDSAKVEAS